MARSTARLAWPWSHFASPNSACERVKRTDGVGQVPRASHGFVALPLLTGVALCCASAAHLDIVYSYPRPVVIGVQRHNPRRVTSPAAYRCQVWGIVSKLEAVLPPRAQQKILCGVIFSTCSAPRGETLRAGRSSNVSHFI